MNNGKYCKDVLEEKKLTKFECHVLYLLYCFRLMRKGVS